MPVGVNKYAIKMRKSKPRTGGKLRHGAEHGERVTCPIMRQLRTRIAEESQRLKEFKSTFSPLPKPICYALPCAITSPLHLTIVTHFLPAFTRQPAFAQRSLPTEASDC
ncbi:unnamed protein product [Lepidochelys kempii]